MVGDVRGDSYIPTWSACTARRISAGVWAVPGRFFVYFLFSFFLFFCDLKDVEIFEILLFREMYRFKIVQI
jgi:hypothetical protein